MREHSKNNMQMISPWRCWGLNRVVWAALALFCCRGAQADDVADRLRNDPAMMPFYTGTILPTPQQATYSNEFLSLAKTGIWLGRGLDQDDRRVTILRNRITQYGGSTKFVTSLGGDFETCICLGDCPPAESVAVPDQEEGYAIRAFRKDGTNVVVLKGHDARGLLWAVASLNQLITHANGACVVQKAEVFDYPAIKTRGFLWAARCEQSIHPSFPIGRGWPSLRL